MGCCSIPMCGPHPWPRRDSAGSLTCVLRVCFRYPRFLCAPHPTSRWRSYLVPGSQGQDRDNPGAKTTEAPQSLYISLCKALSFRNGEGGIRTRGALSGTLVFETSTISRSVTSPDKLFDFHDRRGPSASDRSGDCTLDGSILQETVAQ